MRFDCPNCHQGIEVEGGYMGRKAHCPHCHGELKVPMAPGGPPRAVLVVADDEDEDSPMRWAKASQKVSAAVAHALQIVFKRRA